MQLPDLPAQNKVRLVLLMFGMQLDQARFGNVRIGRFRQPLVCRNKLAFATYHFSNDH